MRQNKRKGERIKKVVITAKLEFMGQEVIEERRQYAIEKAWNGVKKELLHLTPDIFSCSIAKKQSSKSRSLKGERAFAAAVKSLLHLGPELFAPSPTPRLTEKPRAKTTRQRKSAVRARLIENPKVTAAEAVTHLSQRGRQLDSDCNILIIQHFV